MLKYYTLLFAICLTQLVYGQCPPNSPGYLSGNSYTITATDTVPAAVFSTAPSGLPNTEFVLIQNNLPADDGFGPAVLRADSTGKVVPADLGLSTCDELCVVPFSYDLSQLKTVVDSLFGAYYLPPTITCCDAADNFFMGICDSLVAYGISSSNDVNDLNDVIIVMRLFSGTANTSFSLLNLTQTIDALNSSLTLFGGCAGGISEICYAVEDSMVAKDCYTIVVPNAADSVYISGTDTVIVTHGNGLQLSGGYSPSNVTDSLNWSVVGGNGSITVDPNTGYVNAGSQNDTAWVIAAASLGCIKDSILVYSHPVVGTQQLVTETMPISAYPNPVDKQVHLRFFVQQAATYQLLVMDARGQQVYAQQNKLAVGNQQLTVDLQDLPNGYYFVRLVSTQQSGTKVLLKR